MDSSHDTAGMLLGLIAMVTQLEVVLEEAEAGEIKAVKPRLKRLKALVASLPEKATPKPTLGFKGRVRKPRTQ